MKTVSVIIPTYNYAHYIREAIDSVLNQTYPQDEIEIIVVDDGSTDNTKEVLREFRAEGVIKYFYQNNKGKANATQFAINASTGKYILNLDADDYFLPNKIMETVAVFEANKEVVHVASPAKYINEQSGETGIEKLPKVIVGKPLNGDWLLNYFYTNNILFGGGTTYGVRASIVKNVIISDEVDMYIDEFLILAILPFGKSFFVQEPLSIWRIHNSNYSGKTTDADALRIKGERLLRSSAAIYDYVKANNFDSKFVRLYKIRHATRSISLLETIKEKKALDILKYSSKVINSRPSFKIIKSYYVLNRLIPSQLFRFVKKLKLSIKGST